MKFSAEPYRGKRVCVAFSGGVDSVCLLHLFREEAEAFGITLSAVHVEHGIRGEESVRDMEFCEALCRRWGIPLTVVREDVPKLVQEHGGGLEERARAVRYNVFREILGRGEADLVATAHHADDVAETILFRLARGTGPYGMRAISQYGGIVRPLLSVTRAELEAYAEQKGLPHVEDTTNENENYTRNYIRRTVLPAFEKIHKNAAKHLVEFAALAAEEDDFLETLARSKIVSIGGEMRVPAGLPDVLFARACLICLRQYARGGYTRANLEEIAKLKKLQSGKRVAVPLSEELKDAISVYAFREGREIVFDREEKDGPPRPAECPFEPKTGQYACSAGILGVRELETGEAEDIKAPFQTKKLLVDLDAFPEGCVVRARREGDVITPYHAPKKTLKKFLTDRKIPSRLSKKLPVVAKGNEVFAVAGVEIADSVKVTEKTRRRAVIQ